MVLGFSVVSYNSSDTLSHTIWHWLDKKPEMIIVKNRNMAYNWDVFHKDLTWGSSLIFTNASKRDNDIFWAEWNQVSSITFTTKYDYTIRWSDNYIAYAFHSVPGFSKIGKYSWRRANWDVVDLGFRPAYVMIKKVNWNWDWIIRDNKRWNNIIHINKVWTDLSNSEIVFHDNWFSLNWASTNTLYEYNNNWWEYIYYAIAE